jgi:uncharacterized protein
MKRLLGIWVMVVVLTMGSATVVLADFEAGLTAAKKGDFATALREWKPLAEQGNVSAQTNLGRMYQRGDGVALNYEEAAKWYRKAADQGRASAQNSLGRLYNYGKGVVQDYKEAAKWYFKAAEQGNSSAQNSLGGLYKYGMGVAQDYKEAVKWYRKAAKQGHAGSQNNLGLMFAYGQGVKRNSKEAVRLIKLAIKNGVRGGHAETTLGWWYFTGEHAPEIDRNFDESIIWSFRGARKGHPGASENLALMYFGGFGVEQNYYAMLSRLVQSVANSTSGNRANLDGADEWDEYSNSASKKFITARKAYLNAIRSGKKDFFDALLELKREASSGGKESCNTLPKPKAEFGGMRLESFEGFSDKRLGIGLTYSSSDERLSVFKFDNGYEEIDNWIVRENLDGSIDDIVDAGKKEGGRIVASKYLGPTPFTTHSLISHLINFSYHGKVKFEFVGLGHDGLCFSKVRYTYGEDANFNEAMKRYGEYTERLGRYISR